MMNLSWIIWVSPKCHHKRPYKTEAEVDQILRGEGDMKTAEKDASNNDSHKNLEDTEIDVPLQSCQHLDFGHLASKTVREYISIVFSYHL